jgi:hypothetical protein
VRRRAPAEQNRRIFLLAALALVAAVTLVVSFAPRQTAVSDAPLGDTSQLRVYRIATGTFALPAPGRAPFQYVEADSEAHRTNNPVAYTIWVEQSELETAGWRDLLQVGRIPVARPPKVDFAREVAVLVWPVPSLAPDGIMRANGLSADALVFQHVSLELRVKADTGGAVPATAIAPYGLAPYALFTIPRNQWPLPAPPPTVPPLTVTLAR